MTGTGQDDVDRALAAVGAKSFVYRSFRRQPRPAELVAADAEPEPKPEPQPEPEPERAAAVAAPVGVPENVAEPAVAEPVLAEPPAPATMPVEEPMPTQTAPTREDRPAQALTFEAAAPVFAPAPPAPPAPPPPNTAIPEPASPAVPEPQTKGAPPSEDLDRQSVAAMFRLLTGRVEPPRRTEVLRRVEPSPIPAPPVEPPPAPARPEPAPLGFGLANHLSSRIGGPEPRPGLRDIRPEPRPAADPPGATRPAIPSTDAPPVDQGLFRRL